MVRGYTSVAGAAAEGRTTSSRGPARRADTAQPRASRAALWGV